ncbi:type I methionyl aminopeptidase [Candidatus Nesciobacter abundans]|nr:type I methionyl aminopeptidase [Candidatus Nesciobacter abundans]
MNKLFELNSKGIKVYNPDCLDKMKKSSAIVLNTLKEVESKIKAGLTTKEVDKICEDYIKSCGARPTCKGYQGYPAASCISVNEVVCHGVPSDRIIKDGDIVNVDVVAEIDGWHSDSSRTFMIGSVSDKRKKLVEVSKKAMEIGIQSVEIGKDLKEIGIAIEKYVLSQGSFKIVKEFCGHGIGMSMHEKPFIYHFDPKHKLGKIVPGMFFTVEPIIVNGEEDFKELKDGWTTVTKDGSDAAQFEHTIYVGYDGKVHILTDG